MQSIKQVQRLNQRELEAAIPSSASWHSDYRDTAYIYVGGLPLELSEGDVITIFSQYGEPVWIKLARDKDTGKSRGFAWLKYEDQRSCDLAVDNLSGATVMGRLLAVDHARYKKRDDEDEAEGYVGQEPADDRRGRRAAQAASPDSDGSEARRPLVKEELELAKLLEDQGEDDPMKAYMIEQKREEVERALASLKKTSGRSRGKDDHRSHGRRVDDDQRRRHRRRRERSRERQYPRSRSRSRSRSPSPPRRTG